MRFYARAALLLAALLLAFPALGNDKRLLSGQRPAETARLKPLGDLPPSTRLDLAIGLPLRNKPALADFLQQLYDPASPNFHHYLTPEQFTKRFGPTEQDYQRVIDYATKQGLKITDRHPNRLLLDVSGTSGAVEKAFQIKMRIYQHPAERRTFFAPDTDPSIDADMPILDINGLHDYVQAHPMNLKRSDPHTALQPTPATGSGVGGTFMPADLRAAYVPNLTLYGTGQSVGLFELEGYYSNDIANYEHAASLANVRLTNVLIDGFSGTPDSNLNYIGEVSLDIEMAIAMAPQLSKVMVYEAQNTNLTFTIINDLLNRMATDNAAKQLSSSWAWGGGSNASTDQIFIQYATQGQSFFEASGDSGAYVSGNPIESPSDDVYVTVVGGTTLTTSGPVGSWVSEKVWNWFPNQASASSGGVSSIYSLPTWQQGISMTNNLGSTNMRNIPDVALTADNILVYYGNGIKQGFGGTSCAAPLWAGFTALVNQHEVAHGQSTVGFINPAVYSIGQGTNYTNDFHDITVGNNTNGLTQTNYFAVPGYDLCTGWGTPNGTAMIEALAPGLSPIAPTVTWATPASIVYGTALSATQLKATANVAGTFTYNPAAGSVLGAGTTTLSVVFNPSNTFDYNSITTSVMQVVTKAPLNVTASNATRIYGQSNPAFAFGYRGFVNGDAAGVLSGSPSLSTTATLSSSVAGSPYPISVSVGTLSANNYSFVFQNGQLTITPASSSDALSSSANPVPAGSNITFTATLTAVAPGSGTPTGTVQFYADGSPLGSPATLVGGLASISTSSLAQGMHAISNQYGGDGNFFGSTADLSPEESINPGPVAGTVSLPRNPNGGVKMTVADLLTNGSDPESETLTLVSAGPASTNGGSVAVANGWIFYTPVPGYINTDAFSYVIQDTGGAQAAGTVVVTVPVDLAQSQNITGIQTVNTNSTLISFQGIAGRTYSVQYTTNLASPSWQTLGTAAAGATGAFEFTDTPPNDSPARVYRSTYP